MSNITKKTFIMQKRDNSLFPMYQKDIEKFNKIKQGELLEVETFKNRNILHHRKLFGICNEFVNNDFFIQMLDKWDKIQQAFDFQLTLSNEAVQEIRFKYKSDSYAYIYICKWLFLPLEEIILPDGKILNTVSSINFRELGQDEFEIFYNKCIELLAFIIEVTPDKLNEMF